MRRKQKMNSILFFPDEADVLNSQVQKKIDKHLFLFCNYNPDSLRTYSYDAKFFLGIMNMYKLLIDTGVCNKIGGIKKKYSLSFDNEKFASIISIIQSFRTYLAHNVDYRNANEEDKVKVERWFSQLIGKKAPENADQYEKPLEEMIKNGEECIKLLNGFVDEVSNHARKNEIIAEWVELIFKFYKRPNSSHIIKGRITLAYQALKGTTKIPRSEEIAFWTQKVLLYPEQKEIKDLKNILDNEQYLSENYKKKISERIKEKEKSILTKKKNVANHLKKTENNLKIFDYLNYYVGCFPERIRKKYEEGTLESLLPQDVVDQIIEDDNSSLLE